MATLLTKDTLDTTVRSNYSGFLSALKLFSTFDPTEQTQDEGGVELQSLLVLSKDETPHLRNRQWRSCTQVVFRLLYCVQDLKLELS